MKLRDKYGWPVTTIEGFHPIINTIRYMIHTNIKQTWKMRKRTKDCPWDVVHDNCTQAYKETK